MGALSLARASNPETEEENADGRYIGLDAPASSCTLAVVGPSGKRLGSHVVETNARALIEVLRGIPRNRHVCLEEGTLSGWLYEVLEPDVEETGVRKSRGPKSDKVARRTGSEPVTGGEHPLTSWAGPTGPSPHG